MRRSSNSYSTALGKLGLWGLIFCVSFWSFNNNSWVTLALANYITLDPTATVTETQRLATGGMITITRVLFRTTTHTGTQTGTFTNGGPSTNTNMGSSTDTNCHTGGGQYGGGQWNWCNRSDPNQQRNTQDDNKDLNNNGANQSTALGMAAIAAGMALVAAGVALLPPPTTPAGVALIAAGMALIAAGMAALAAASKMNNNANKSNGNALKLDNLNDKFKSTISDGSGKSGTGSSALGDANKTNLGEGNTSGIKIDPALMRTGKMDAIFSDMEKRTGLNRDDFLKSMQNGGDPLNLLANSPALAGKAGASEANLQKMMDDTLAKGNLPSGQEVMDKLGLTKDDLGVINGGTDPNKNAGASNASPNIDALFPMSSPEKPVPSQGNNDNAMKMSPEIQAALDKKGITNRSIFEMIHAQYKKKTLQMLGVQQKKIGSEANPFNSLEGDKLEL